MPFSTMIDPTSLSMNEKPRYAFGMNHRNIYFMQPRMRLIAHRTPQKSAAMLARLIFSNESVGVPVDKFPHAVFPAKYLGNSKIEKSGLVHTLHISRSLLETYPICNTVVGRGIEDLECAGTSGFE